MECPSVPKVRHPKTLKPSNPKTFLPSNLKTLLPYNLKTINNTAILRDYHKIFQVFL